MKNVSRDRIQPPLQPVSSLQSFPGEMLQMDLVGPFSSPHYRYVLTAIDVFTKYLFAVPLTRVTATPVASNLVSIFFKHSYIPDTIVSDLGSVFTSKLMHELTNMLEIKLKHATLKHPQTVGVVERAHGALKRILKLHTNEQWTDWYRYVDLACFIHNTSYYSSIGCTPSLLFHGREPVKPLDIRFKNRQIRRHEFDADYVNDLKDALNIKYSENQENLINSYHKYRIF